MSKMGMPPVPIHIRLGIKIARLAWLRSFEVSSQPFGYLTEWSRGDSNPQKFRGFRGSSGEARTIRRTRIGTNRE